MSPDSDQYKEILRECFRRTLLVPEEQTELLDQISEFILTREGIPLRERFEPAINTIDSFFRVVDVSDMDKRERIDKLKKQLRDAIHDREMTHEFRREQS